MTMERSISERVGTITVPIRLADATISELKKFYLAWETRPLHPEETTREFTLFGDYGDMKRLPKALQVACIPFHTVLVTGQQSYGIYEDPERYALTGWLPMGIQKTVDWDQQEHIHKQQKVYALLDT